MYSYAHTHITPHISSALLPVSNTPCQRNQMPLLLRIFCTSSSSPIPRNNTPLSKSLALNPPILNPITNLNLRFPLPLPAPDLPDSMKEKIISLELMGLDPGRLLCLNPDLREASLESIHKVVYFLQSKGIRQKDLARIIGVSPRIITSDIKNDLVPVFDFLSKDLEVPDRNFYNVIGKCPRILASSARDQLKPALFYLQRLGLKEKSTLAYRYPVLLVLNVEKKLIPKVEFLMSLGFSYEDTKVLVYRSLDLLTFSIENNFKPKSEYYFREMKGNLDELKEFPQYFAFSLEQRIKPRHKELVEKGIEMPLAVMLKSMDVEFRKLVEQLEKDRHTKTNNFIEV